MISVESFLAKIREIEAEHPVYDTGGDGRGGRCDCIGLIIGALRRAGEEWQGLHGSNWAARKEMRTLFDVTSENDLSPGMVVYKYRDPFEAGYLLPARYRDGSQRDYYHVGVVVAVNPLKILHCTSWSEGSGIKTDTSLGKWRVAGWLKKIKEGKAETMAEPMKRGIVKAATGGTVRLRANPDRKAVVLDNVPVGTGVEVQGKCGEWYKISVGGKTGWMMEEYIAPYEGEPAGDAQDSAPDTVTVTLARDAAAYLLEALKGGLSSE